MPAELTGWGGSQQPLATLQPTRQDPKAAPSPVGTPPARTYSMPVAPWLARYEADRMNRGSLDERCGSIPVKQESGGGRSGHLSLTASV